MASAVNDGFVSTFSSKHDSLVPDETIESFGDVLILINSGLAFRPKWASNGVTFVVAFGECLNYIGHI